MVGGGGQGGRMDLPKITVPVSGKIALEHKFPSSQANDLSNASLQEKKK